MIFEDSKHQPESNYFNKLVKFETLDIGDEFECYGDTFINYNYPKICRCVKTDNDKAEEIDGIGFYLSVSDEVFIKNSKN